MRYYASRTGTRRNLAALRAHGCGLLVSRAGEWRDEGFDDIIADNGAWADHQAGRDFDEDEFEQFLCWLERERIVPRFIVLPDIVAGGLASLALSLRYRNRCLSIAPLVMLPVQDGMAAEDVALYVGPSVGIFLGGSTDWKLSTMRYWGEFCCDRNIPYHVARLNSIKRIALAIWAGADSGDGSSASRFAVTVAKLAYATRQQDLFSP